MLEEKDNDVMEAKLHFDAEKSEEDQISINDGPSFVSPARICHDNFHNHSRKDSNLTAVALL